MAKTALNVRSLKSSLQSIKDVPFTGAEIKELQLIQEKGYSARKSLKEDFCDRNNRMISEVNEYFMKHKNPPKGGKGSYTRNLGLPNSPLGRSVATAIEKVRAPKGQITTVPLETKGEIKITFRSMRVEGNVITFEL